MPGVSRSSGSTATRASYQLPVQRSSPAARCTPGVALRELGVVLGGDRPRSAAAERVRREQLGLGDRLRRGAAARRQRIARSARRRRSTCPRAGRDTGSSRGRRCRRAVADAIAGVDAACPPPARPELAVAEAQVAAAARRRSRRRNGDRRRRSRAGPRCESQCGAGRCRLHRPADTRSARAPAAPARSPAAIVLVRRRARPAAAARTSAARTCSVGWKRSGDACGSR